jgi:hypothetical protein
MRPPAFALSGVPRNSRDRNPDLDPNFQFPPAVAGLSAGQFPAIPRANGDLTPNNHIQAIADTRGFHFAFIEQGGTSLYPSLAQRVTSPEVLRILLSIGPTRQPTSRPGMTRRAMPFSPPWPL